MKKLITGVLCISLFVIGFIYVSGDSYQEKAAQMIMVGFDGLSITRENPIYNDIKKNHIGGVILFNTQGFEENTKKNIDNFNQVQTLIQQLQQISPTPLFVAIDQEGGQVSRLPPQFGVSTYSAWALGQQNDLSLTEKEANKTADVLKQLGINVNFAPCVDLVLNEDSIIKKKDRAFSQNDPKIVVNHAEQFIKAYQSSGILPVLKHFPGHGSATGDTHVGFVDITNTYQDIELVPYQILLPKYPDIGVMVAHVFNKKVDEKWPLSLSYNNITQNLQNNLKFQGVIFSDDLQMGALTTQYSWHDIVVGAINAGNDVLVIGNNLSYDPQIADKTLKIIVQALKDGEITPSRIDQSYQKIINAKRKLTDIHSKK